MPRYHIIICDSSDNTIEGHIVKKDHPCDAIVSHPWITSIYRDEWVESNIKNPTIEGTVENILSTLGWHTLCVNLDEEIMKKLNDGDSNVSSSTHLQ